MAATGTPTPNIGLRRPQGTDPASVDDINYNSNLIDTKMGPVGNTSVQAQINSLNSKFTKKEYQFSDLAFSAGTIGTRGVQTSINITSDMNAYGTLISLLITFISDSNKCHFQVFRYGDDIYLNGYRASDSAMANNSVYILATYMKN